MRFAFSHFVLDCDQRVLWSGDEIVPLSPKAFDTLRLLVTSSGRIVTKQEFMETLWPDSFVEDSNLTQTIFVVRKVLGASSGGGAYIETVPKRGYRFVGTAHAENRAVTPETPPSIEAAEPATVAEPSISDGEEGAFAPLRPVGDLALADPAPGDRAGIWVWLSWIGVAMAMALLLAAGSYGLLRSRARIRVGGYLRLTNDGRSKDVRLTPSTLVTDGNSVYFTEAEGTQNILARVPAQGGETSYAPAPSQSAHLLGWQPDARSFLFGSYWDTGERQPLLSLDPATQHSTPVLATTAQDASWSPDGRELAYAQRGRVFVRSSEGSTSLLASVAGQAYWIRWSPDGHTIRFSENYEGFHDRLWEVSRAEGRLHLLFPDQSDSDHACCGSWTKSGQSFVYLSIQASNNSIRIRPEHPSTWKGWAQKAIAIPAAPLDKWTAPVPSPDGKHVFAIGEQLRGQLVSIDALTRQPKPLLAGLSAEGVSFSPDGQQITWTSYPEGTLWRSRSDGSERIQLTQSPLLARFPHWSPDGSTIVFTAATPGSNWQVYRVPSRGGKPTLLLPEANGQGVPTWAPDGQQIVFGHTANGSFTTTPFFIEIFRLGDRQASRIPGSEGLWTPRLSPNGRFLSAVTVDNRRLRLYDFATKTWTDLAQASVNDVVWSPDSESLFFDTQPSAKPLLYRVRLGDKRLEVWANLDHLKRAGFFAPWLGVTPGGEPILLEDTSIQELYSVAVNLP